LKIIVGQEFEKITQDPEREVLVKFFHPRCEDCKALAIDVAALAEEVKNVKGLMIAQYDTSSNENEGLELRNLPVVRFYSKDHPKGTQVKYDNQNATKTLKDFLRHNSAKYKKN